MLLVSLLYRSCPREGINDIRVTARAARTFLLVVGIVRSLDVWEALVPPSRADSGLSTPCGVSASHENARRKGGSTLPGAEPRKVWGLPLRSV